MVRYPHKRHGLAGKTSNRTKSDVQQYNVHDTVHFKYRNIIQFYCKYTKLFIPHDSEGCSCSRNKHSKYNTILLVSQMGVRVRATVLNITSYPNLHPHMTTVIHAKSLKATKRRLVESGSAQLNEIHQIETKLQRLKHKSKRIRKTLSKLVNSIIQ